jgi:hypothetical protein
MPTAKDCTVDEATNAFPNRMGADREFPFVAKHARVVAFAASRPRRVAVALAGIADTIECCAIGQSEDGSWTKPLSDRHGNVARLRLTAPAGVAHVSLSPSARLATSASADDVDLDAELAELVAGPRTSVLVGTVDGGIFALQSSLPGASERLAGEKAPRRAGSSSASNGTRDADLVAIARWDASDEGSAGCASQALRLGMPSSASTFALARYGTAGRADGAASHIAAAVEFANEVRLFDVQTGANLRSVYTAHGPTEVLPALMPGLSPNQELLFVAEGPVCSVWDPRTGGRGSNACISRLTLHGVDVVDLAVDAALAARSVIIAAAADRSITSYDARKWAKIAVEQNALKYAPSGAAVIGVDGSRPYEPTAVLVTGIDSEARCVELQTSASTMAATRVREQRKAAGLIDDDDKTAAPLQGTFRQRLASSMHCRAAWHGAPVRGAFNDGQFAAAALSTHGQLFMAARQN